MNYIVEKCINIINSKNFFIKISKDFRNIIVDIYQSPLQNYKEILNNPSFGFRITSSSSSPFLLVQTYNITSNTSSSLVDKIIPNLLYLVLKICNTIYIVY